MNMLVSLYVFGYAADLIHYNVFPSVKKMFSSHFSHNFQ